MPEVHHNPHPNNIVHAMQIHISMHVSKLMSVLGFKDIVLSK